MILFWQGHNHLSQTKRFIDANEKHDEPWLINHPYYGEIRVQPYRMKVDNRKFNISVISVAVTETIRRDGLTYQDPSIPKIKAVKAQLDVVNLERYELALFDVDATDVDALTDSVDQIEEAGKRPIFLSEEITEFKNVVSKAQNAATNMISDVESAISRTQELINYPFTVISDFKTKILTAKDMFDKLVNSVENILGISDNERARLTGQTSAIVSSGAIAAISNLDIAPYDNALEVQDTIDLLSDLRDSYIQLLDDITTDTSFPDPDVVTGVEFVIDEAISNLTEIAFNSAQEFSIFTDGNDNVIELAHRFYGAENDDSNIDKLILTNQIGLNEILSIPAERVIKYYK